MMSGSSRHTHTYTMNNMGGNVVKICDDVGEFQTYTVNNIGGNVVKSPR